MEDFDIGKWFRGAFGRLVDVIKWVFAIVGGVSFLIAFTAGVGALVILGVVCFVVVYIIEGD